MSFGKERRQHKRMENKWPLSYSWPEQSDSVHSHRKGITTNVSIGGLYFYPINHDQNLALNQVLHLSILYCGQDSKELFSIKAQGEVLRLDKETPHPSKLRVALRFLTTPSVR